MISGVNSHATANFVNYAQAPKSAGTEESKESMSEKMAEAAKGSQGNLSSGSVGTILNKLVY